MKDIKKSWWRPPEFRKGMLEEPICVPYSEILHFQSLQNALQATFCKARFKVLEDIVASVFADIPIGWRGRVMDPRFVVSAGVAKKHSDFIEPSKVKRVGRANTKTKTGRTVTVNSRQRTKDQDSPMKSCYSKVLRVHMSGTWGARFV